MPLDFPALLEAIAADKAGGTPVEIWFADEARVGQKNKITRRWAKRGTRPSAPKDQRTASAYIFGAICPDQGKGAGLVLPRCTTEAMALQLAEIAQAVSPGAHAVVLLDRAGWQGGGGDVRGVQGQGRSRGHDHPGDLITRAHLVPPML